ncbi:MAG TPA: tRNA epoxyqueuosine(34) reductase QueG [Ignavibacteriales bacterium]|nr:tRNA epoxyqueuosine(34) reductase QueG [Ignavibacteriales bacterium]HRR19127.1 tRNA epoxyqueuosine(34) reductase QueG [Ignavibacteriales bacterium]
MKITKNEIISIAKKLGFDLIGFTKYQKLLNEVDNLKKWLNNGYHAKMEYMQKNLDKKEDPHLILPDCKVVVSLGMNYYQEIEYKQNKAKISKYALGKDYHYVMWKKLQIFVDELKLMEKNLSYYYNVDTGPVLDKAWAVKAGLGWLGKNSNLINPKKGSFFFLATVFLNIEIDFDEQIITDHCGNCTRCIDACPTQAIVESYVVDSNKCISYLTIENKEDISLEFIGKFENWAFGCDICQDVCPWNNKFSVPTQEKRFLEHLIEPNIEFDYFDKYTNSQFKQRFKFSPITRAKLKGLIRNLNFIRVSNQMKKN